MNSAENSALTTGTNYIIKYIKVEKSFIISLFLLYFYQINSSLVSRRDLFLIRFKKSLFQTTSE